MYTADSSGKVIHRALYRLYIADSNDKSSIGLFTGHMYAADSNGNIINRLYLRLLTD